MTRGLKLESEGLTAWGISGAGCGVRTHAALGMNHNSDKTGNALAAEPTIQLRLLSLLFRYTGMQRPFAGAVWEDHVREEAGMRSRSRTLDVSKSQTTLPNENYGTKEADSMPPRGAGAA